jgi:hypothetical protein
MLDTVRVYYSCVVRGRFVYSIFGLTRIPPNFKIKIMYNISMTQHSLTTLSNASATLLTPNGIHSGLDVTIQNTHATAIVYLGAVGVTSSNYGYRLSPGAAWSIELSGRDSLYAISNTNESTVAVLTTNLELGH